MLRFIFAIIFVLGAVMIAAGPVAAASPDGRCPGDLAVLGSEAQANHLFVHAVLEDLVKGSFEAEKLSYGYRGPMKGYGDGNLIFLRDYFPVQIESQKESGDAAANPVLVKYFSYRTLTAHGAPYVPQAPWFTPGIRVPEGFTKDAVLVSAGGKQAWFETRMLPLLAEGGNLLPAGRKLLTTGKIFADNARSLEDVAGEIFANKVITRDQARVFTGYLKELGYRGRTREEVLAALASAFGIGGDDIVVMPWLPGSPMGHVDMYLGVINDETVAVPYIPEKLISLTQDENERHFARQVSPWLDTQAETLQKAGFKVERIPMLPPKNLKPSALSPFGYDADYLTPVNWAMVKDRVVVPRFEKYLNALPEETRAGIENEITSKLAKYGFATRFLAADGLVGTNSGFHCVTATLKMP